MDRIQGTDGIRRDVRRRDDAELAGLSPWEAFVERARRQQERTVEVEAPRGQGIARRIDMHPFDRHVRLPGGGVRLAQQIRVPIDRDDRCAPLGCRNRVAPLAARDIQDTHALVDEGRVPLKPRAWNAPTART